MKDTAFGIIPFYQKNKDYYYLLIRHNAGHWAFPKGHQNLGETAIQTACREFVEETGLKDYKISSEISFIERYSFFSEGQLVEKTVEYFIAEVDNHSLVTIQKEEIQDFKWVSYNEALKLITFIECKELFVKIHQYITSL
ncbi:MAG: NUDIX domain-containing protein [Nitrospirae bacterium]|nr:NUDIX domain-containing protein [Nitrospirota bacterium]MBF0542244.1 NUDIX domain-containing protein [Nitrospirota bacterium]